ncbi:MAG: diadenylate cyclase CdaA [Nitrospirota bacterium]
MLNFITDILKEIRWQDIIDIAIVTFVFYRLLLLIKGTRAFHMLMGLVVLFVTFVISRWAGLYTLDWLIQSFGSYIVLALIILFQPEIKKALAQMGQNPLTQRLIQMEKSKYIEEIIRASVSMASKKIGAIIVIERNTELKDLVEMGIQLDARITRELLTSIFLPYSPIHDGAVIIKGDRIAAAGCFLPLTLSADVSKSLGTRHRAAIGVTEETDAVVIVVSEETGDISVSIDGNIMRKLDTSALRRVLMNIFQQQKGKDKNRWFGSERINRIIAGEEINK